MEDFCPTMQRCDVMELLPFFLDIPIDSPPVNVTPSRLFSELQMPMQKRFEQLTRPTRKRRILTEVNTFIITPDVIVFQNFEAYETYKTTLTFVNTKSTSKNFKIGLAYKSPFFSIIRPGSEYDFLKVAPGIAYVINIIFSPTEMRDYVAKLICDTDDETITIPLYGIGTRPLLKIVDEIKLNPTAVRVKSEKSILLHNLADKSGQYRVTVEEPFDIIPKKAVLESNKAHELKVSCSPVTEEKNLNSHVILHCDDLILKIPVICEVQEADISLQCFCLNFFEVFVGLQNFGTTTVHNNSPFTVDFRWKLLESEKEDVERIKSILKNLKSLTEMEKYKYTKLQYHDVINAEGHQQILDYKFLEMAENINEEFKLMYTNEAFSIIPLEGKILPHQSFDFNLIFAPTKNDVYLSSAYLDVTGRYERFHFNLSGVGKGPSVVFNVNKLNTGTIFLEAEHEYQVIVKNDGCIPATVIFQKTESEFGCEIGCNPEAQYLKKNDSCKPFIISFSSTVQGPFIEKVYFKIKESEELIFFLLVGNVVCPLLKPNVEKLDFGHMAFATETTKKVILTNPSQVPIEFQVKFSKINYSEMFFEGKKEKKQDFSYNPDVGVVSPYACVAISVKLFTNVIDSVNETMIICMYGSDNYKIEIPCSYTCLIPTITCDPQDIYITFCFLNFVYKRTLTFTNETGLTGQLNYTPTEEPKNMRVSLSPTEILIPPHNKFEVELTITTDVLGLHEYLLMFTLVGQETPTRYCNLKCNGQGPVVSYFPDTINFGQVQLLTTAIKQMSIVNDSPIKAKIFLTSTNTAEVQLPVEELDLFPECEVQVDVVCYLTEDGKFDCQIFVDVENGENIVIKVNGEGIGYPLQCVPKLEPEYDLGSHLTYLTNKLPVAISNLGRKYYRIYWSRKSYVKSLKELMVELETPPAPNAIFWFEPNYLELCENSNESIDICARSKIAHYYEELFYMYGTIDPNSKSNCLQVVIPIMTVLLKVKFIVPVISFSTQHLKFVEMHVPSFHDPYCTTDEPEIPLESISTREVIIRNEVEIPLTLLMRTTDDFLIKIYQDEYEDTYYHKLEVGREVTVIIEFQPQQFSKRYTKSVGKLIVNIPDYPKTESISLTGEMCFPSTQFLPQELDFGCLEIGSYNVRTIIMQNVTFLPVKYSLNLLTDIFHLQQLPQEGATMESKLPDLKTDNISICTDQSSTIKISKEKSREKSSEQAAELLEERVKQYINPSTNGIEENDEKPVEQQISLQQKRLTNQSGKEESKRESVTVAFGNVDDDIKLMLDETKQSIRDIKSPSEQSLSEICPSQNVLETAMEVDPQKVNETAKIILNHLLYKKHEEADSTNLETRDFWTEMKRTDPIKTHILQDILTIEPWQGCLKPYEYNLINLYFHPLPNTITHCSAVCQIQGGEEDRIQFNGICSNIAYSFDRTSIDVGRQLFCEILQTSLTLTNNGFYDFPVVVRCDDEEIFFNKKIKANWLNIFPKSYYLEAGKSVEFKVCYFPGMTGVFEEDLIFDIAFLDPIKIPLKGYAVFSQVIINVPRQELHRRYRTLSYRGIANVNEKYLLCELPRKKNVTGGRMSHTSAISRSSVMSHFSVEFDNRMDPKFTSLLDEDWEVIFRDDPMPSVKDLDLALEQTILNDQLCVNYDELKKHSITRKCRIIPEFKVPAYRLDFGNVIVDTSVVFSLRVTNISPEPAVVKVLKSNLLSLYANDFSIEYKSTVLNYGESLPMHIILRPNLKSSNSIGYDDRFIRDVLYLAVSHGATIPIVITATVALPRFAFIHKCIDFGMIKIGNAFRQSVIIENRGCLTCNWDTEVRSLNDMKPSYYIIPNKGELLAFEQGIMNIYFVPEKKGFCSAEVVVQVQGSHRQVKMKLCGDGVQPNLVFKEANVKFFPCIPYTTDTVELLVQNVSTFSIEFCFSDFEQNYDEEKMLVELFLNYYNLKTVLIPVRELGGGIPEMFLSTYQMLESDLKKIFRNLQPEDASDTDMLCGYTKEQLVDLINKYINAIIEEDATHEKQENTTDIYAVENKGIEGLAIIDPVIPIDGLAEKKGMVVIFHGAPKTEYVRAALNAAKFLTLEPSSIDKLIYDELITGKSNSAEIINNMIDEALNVYEDKLIENEQDDEYDILEKKIDIIMNSKLIVKKKVAKEDKTAHKENDKEISKTDRSKSHYETKGLKDKKITETFLEIPLEYFADILKLNIDKIVAPTLVIESLNSNFIRTPILALECLLHGIGNMRYIQITILSLTLEEYIADETKTILEKETSEQKVLTDTAKEKANKDKRDKKEVVNKILTINTGEEKLDSKLEEKIHEISKDIPSALEQLFKAFSLFVLDLNDVCESWNRRYCALAELDPSVVPAATGPITQTKYKKVKKKSLSGLLKFTSTMTVLDLTNCGIPLIILDNALPNKDNCLLDTINKTLYKNDDFKVALESIRKKTKLENIQESNFMYSVVRGIPRYNKNLSDVFKVINTVYYNPNEEVTEEADTSVYSNISTFVDPAAEYSKTERKSKRKKKSYGKSDHLLQEPTSKSEYQFCNRTVIIPGEILKYEISFNPQSLGAFSHKYRLEIIGYRPSIFVKCQANSILPKLDYTPEVMFNKCIDSVVDKRIDDNFIYIKDVRLLDFGTILLAEGVRTPPYYTRIKLKTISQIPCHTIVQLEEQSQFTIRNSQDHFIPNEAEVEIEVSVQGKRNGTINSELYIAIENNPLVYRLRLTAEVVPLDFSFSPHFLNFDKIPLDYVSRQYIKLTNSTSVNLKWRFVKYDWATRIYKISKLRGEIKLYSVDRVEFEFKPTREEIYLPRTIDIQVFDPLCSEEIPLLLDTITLQSEAVEILVNCVDLIDLGDIRGKREYKFPLKINNNGKTSVQLMIEKMVTPVKAHFHRVRRIFQYSTNSEILHPNKNSGITIKFNPTEEMEFQAIPVFLCQILDPNKPQNVVKKFQIKYSATVILSKFSICPVSDVHFGSLEVWNKRTQMLQLKNIGKATFSYNIRFLNPNGTDASLQKVVEEKKKKEKKNGRGGSFSKLKNATNPNSLEIPGYTIFPSNGTVEVGQSSEITLIFQPNSLGVYKERVLLTVSEPAKEHVDGKEITLYGEASEPWIDFTTLRKMFKEHYIVNSVEDLVVPNDIGTHTYFVISKNTLYFENVCVKKECHAKIHLQNLGQLIAVVVGKVHNSNNFTVSPTQFTVDPYLTEVITVTFKPDSINTFEATLEIGSNATTNNIFELLLRGRSYVPQIKLAELPLPEENENVYKISFKPTYINKFEVQKVKIMNIGVIACQVIIDVTDSGKSMFYVTESDKLMDSDNQIDNLVASSLRINLKPFESTEVYLVFKPHKEVIISSFINIYIIDNPFETYQIEVFGQCYGGDIYIDNLETFNPKTSSIHFKTVAYLLDLGQTPLKLIQKKCFTITNNSAKEIYRFEFCYDVHTLKLIPRVGHLKPLSSKEILAVNMSNVPNNVSKEIISFQYISITYISKEPIPISWDERQQLLSWIETGIGIVEDAHVQQYFRNCVEAATENFLKMKVCKKEEITEKLKLSLERGEPEIMYNSDEWKTIDIFLSFTTDYVLYYNTTTELHFPDTFIRDKSELTFKIKNSGRVPIFIEWKFTIDGVAPKYPFMEINKPEQEDGSSVDVVSSFESCLSTASSLNVGMQSEVYITHPRLLEIVPKKTSISVKEACEFRVIFSPLFACYYTARLSSEIESLHPDLKNIQISITAESLHPEYYFELEDSDYLTRRTMKRCLKFIDANCKILEIHAVGVGITTVKRFFAINTSYSLLNFKIERLEQGDLSYFNCKTPSGKIQKRKKFELVFTFTTQELGTFEDAYVFKTDRKSNEKELQGSCIETKFLVVGVCRKPRVFFKKANLNLAPTLLRIPTQETICLKNEEDEELGFKISKESLLSYDHLQKLKMIPNSGCIPPKTEITMKLIYNAETVGDSTFCIQCLVDRMTTPLTLNVSTKCLEVECKIQYIDQSGEEITLDPNIENIIDMGKIGIKTKNDIIFIFTNIGKTGFFYTWHYNKKNIEHLINVSPRKDKEFISSGSSVKREITFETFKKYHLANFPMKIEISYGPIYNLKFFVAAEFPSCKLSFTDYNFGNCLIQPFFTKNYTNMLIVKNFEPIPVKLDNTFENNENLTVDFKTELIQPQCKKKLPFYFHPKKEGHYEFMVPIVLNCTRRFIKINGSGVKINLQLTNPSDKFMDLGEVKMGKTSRHTFYVVNRTPTQLDTTLFLSQDFPVSKQEFEKLKPEMSVNVSFSTMKLDKNQTQGKMTGKKKKEEKLNTTKTSITKDDETSFTAAVVEPHKPYFFIEPNTSVKMDFNKKYQFVVEFQPNERLENFSQKIFYKIQNVVAPLCSVKGKCLVSEFSLDKEILTFSNVLIGATRVKYVLLRNTGDLPLKFRWQNEHLEYFKVHPIEGYVKPKSDVKVDFSFKVSTIKFQLVKKCICVINNKHPLELTLVANSITKPPPVSTISFSCPVRQKITQIVDIANKTTTLWHLYPVISNKNFVIPSEIVVEPESVSGIPVEYHPKLILDEQATLILPLPDEEILYEFIGKTLPPLPEKKLSIEIKCKQNYWQILPVYNSTDFKQCFEVETVLVSPPTPKTLFKTFGLNLVELLPGEVKEYKWNIYVINEEILELQVIFKDKQSNEYMFYEMFVKVLPPEPIDTIQLITCVRNPVKTKIKIKNPINVPVEFYIVSPCLELHFKNVILMEPYSKQELEILYYPIRNGEFVTTLEAKSEELGIFTYNLYLTANISEVENILKYIVELGSREYATAEIKNTFSVIMDISIKFDDLEFWAEKYAKTILPGETANFTIVFEPSALGVLESKFVICSSVSGPYIFQLYGKCIPPTPKGPFLIKPGGSTYISFFNPFNETREFKYSLDSNMFELKITSEEIKSKKSTKIIVTHPEYIKGQGDISCSYTGKLTVTCESVKWSYYIQTE